MLCIVWCCRQSVVTALASKKAPHAAPNQPPSLLTVGNGKQPFIFIIILFCYM